MRAMILRPWVILLAAGGSRRAGRPKLLMHYQRETLLHRAARIALACRPDGCIVVLGAHAARLGKELRDLPLCLVVNRRWRGGMAGSLKCGLAALPASAPAALVLLADQIAIGPADLELLISAWRRSPRLIANARAGSVPCPPAIFPRRLFAALRRLSGDVGARTLLADSRRKRIEFDMPAALQDIDRPSDLLRYRRSSGVRNMSG